MQNIFMTELPKNFCHLDLNRVSVERLDPLDLLDLLDLL